MGTDQFVVLGAASNLCHGCFQECGLDIHRARDGIIVFVVQKMAVIWSFYKIPVLTGNEMTIGQRPHHRFVVGFECPDSRDILPLDFPVVQVVHDSLDILVQFLHAVADPFLQVLQQMGFQPVDSLFHSSRSLGLSGGRGKITTS